MSSDRFLRQIKFIEEIDKLKHVFRQTLLIGGSRNENDAEHSWHLAVMAILLSEHSSAKNLDLSRVIKMVLIHDLVEIYAGDTFAYDLKGYEDKAEREYKAAEKLFPILPDDQAKEMWDLWKEFEDLATPEARFASCLDRLEPLILNHNTNGHTWQKAGVNYDKVLMRNEIERENAPAFWEYVKEVLDESVEKGILKR